MSNLLANKEAIISKLAIFYVVGGLIFTFLFALYYRWEIFSYFSPGFWSVVITWPFQFPGFLGDFLQYGLAGKPI